jgi:hypothetical protein
MARKIPGTGSPRRSDSMKRARPNEASPERRDENVVLLHPLHQSVYWIVGSVRRDRVDERKLFLFRLGVYILDFGRVLRPSVRQFRANIALFGIRPRYFPKESGSSTTSGPLSRVGTWSMGEAAELPERDPTGPLP